MDQKRVILAAVIALIAAAIVLGLIIAIGGLLPNLFNGNNPTSSNLPVISTSITPAPTYSLSGTPAQNHPTNAPTPTPKPGATNTNPSSNIKHYLGDGFSLEYPNTWGVLTCSNSKNFELDPVSSTDMLDISCNRALKPVTVIVHEGNFSCSGTTLTLGANSVKKSTKTWSDGEVDYRWCVAVAGKTLDITHRTSAKGGTAISTTDYSSQVEDMIKTLSSTEASHS